MEKRTHCGESVNKEELSVPWSSSIPKGTSSGGQKSGWTDLDSGRWALERKRLDHIGIESASVHGHWFENRVDCLSRRKLTA